MTKKFYNTLFLSSLIALPASAAVNCSTKPTCASLGYTETTSDCFDKYIACPLDKNAVKCMRYAEVGQIAYFPIHANGSTSNYKGWLFCDGSFYNKDMYPELAAKLTVNGSVFQVPDYRNAYVRAYSSETSSVITTRYSPGLPNITAKWNSCYEDHDPTSMAVGTGALKSIDRDDTSGYCLEQEKDGGGGYMLRTFDASKYNSIYGASESSVDAIHTPVYAFIYAGKKVTSATNATNVPTGCTQGYYYYTDGTCSQTRNTSKTLKGIVNSYTNNSSYGYSYVRYIWGGSSSSKGYYHAQNICQEKNSSATIATPYTAGSTFSKASGFTSSVSPVYIISTTNSGYWSYGSTSASKCTNSTCSSYSSITPVGGTYYSYYCEAYDYFR